MNIIFSKFLNLDTNKKERILNAAMKEFAQNGYKNASTNEIIKEAKISKGMLFHYINSKKYLYLFLYDYCFKVLGKEFFEKVDLDETDILKRWRKLALLKIEIIEKHPKMFGFIVVANSDASNELKIKNKDFIEKSYAKIYENIDYSDWKEDIDIKRAIDIINFTIEGFSAKQEKAEGAYDYDKIIAELDSYFEFLRKLFQKEGGLK